MNKFLRKYFRGDQGIWGIYVLLCLVSIIVMFSASSYFVYKEDTSYWNPIMSHMSYLLLGGFCAWLLHFTSVRFIRLFGYVMGISFFIFLCLMYVPGIGVKLNGALRWVDIIIRFQPSEGAKLGLVLVVADLLSRKGQMDEKKLYWAVVACTLAICLPIFPSNFSTVALILVVIFVMLALSDLTKKWLKIGVPLVIGALLCVSLYFIVKSVPQDNIPDILGRVTTWVNRVDRWVQEDESVPQNPMDDLHRQITHGKIAIARGGFLGVGPGNSVQRDYVPLAYADSIFTIIIEEYGLAGGIFVLMLYLTLFFRIGRLAIRSENMFVALASIGLMLMIMLQVLINVLVVIGYVPVTGQGLPLIGHGGSSISIMSLYIGVLLALSNDVEKRRAENQEVADVDQIAETNDEIKVIELDEIGIDDDIEEL